MVAQNGRFMSVCSSRFSDYDFGRHFPVFVTSRSENCDDHSVNDENEENEVN